jgi:hypothetical protein
MTPTPQSLVDKAVRLRAESKVPLAYNELVGEYLSDVQIAELWLILDEYQTAVNAVVAAVGDKWVEVWEGRGNRGLEVDGYLIGAKKGYTRERCTDQAGFFSWLLENPSQGLAAVNPNSVRFGSLPPAVRDTFFEKEDVVKPDAVAKPVAIPVEVIERNRE